MRSTVLRLLGVVAVSAVAGCGDHSETTGPASVNGKAANRVILASPTSVRVITRNTPLATAQSASATIGAFGGQLSLPGAGLSVVVPPFALSSPVTLTVRAVAGNQVAYEFEPHGTRFTVPLIVTQNLVGTSAYRSGILNRSLVAGYFASLSDLNPLAGMATVSELLGTSVSLLAKTATFPVFHFSGYLIATGRESAESDESSSAQ
jgi:hypothetical protein